MKCIHALIVTILAPVDGGQELRKVKADKLTLSYHNEYTWTSAVANKTEHTKDGRH